MAAHIGRNEVAEVVALVVHSQHDTLQLEPRIERPLHALDRAYQLAQPFERIELALQRHQHRISGHQRIDCQQVQ